MVGKVMRMESAPFDFSEHFVTSYKYVCGNLLYYTYVYTNLATIVAKEHCTVKINKYII